jgi:hypothetical protein
MTCEQQAFLLRGSGGLLHVDTALNGTTSDFVPSVREDFKGRKGRVHREEAASIFSEHTNILATRDTTSAELGQRYMREASKNGITSLKFNG